MRTNCILAILHGPPCQHASGPLRDAMDFGYTTGQWFADALLMTKHHLSTLMNRIT